jgi:glycosyltransferase involved in cell wall biosynthesis
MTTDARVALVSLVSDGFGGLESHVLNLARCLRRVGRESVLVVTPNSRLHEAASDDGLLCHPVAWMSWVRGQPVRDVLLARTLLSLGSRQGLSAIHCNNRFEVRGAVRAAHRLGCPSVMNYHVTSPFDTSILKGLSAFVAPNADIVSFVRQENTMHMLGIAAVEHVPPLIDAARQWFVDHLGLRLRDDPIVCMIGNMVPDLLHKNYPLFFRALRLLKEQKGLHVQALLVGDGPARPQLESLAAELGLRDDVHFLGFRSAEVPGIIGKSDLLVLASSREAFGIVLVEAALMHRVAVAARRTGAESIIVDHETGLLFDNGDEASLAQAIETVLRDTDKAQRLAACAYDRANAMYVPEVVLQRYLSLYGAASRC